MTTSDCVESVRTGWLRLDFLNVGSTGFFKKSVFFNVRV